LHIDLTRSSSDAIITDAAVTDMVIAHRSSTCARAIAEHTIDELITHTIDELITHTQSMNYHIIDELIARAIAEHIIDELIT
jgi:hypothetical protein